MAPKKGMTTNFFSLCLSLLFLDPGSEIRDPGWVKIRIRDKNPGSATLVLTHLSACGADPECEAGDDEEQEPGDAKPDTWNSDNGLLTGEALRFCSTVLWNRNHLLRFRFRLWNSFGSGSGSNSGSKTCKQIF